MINLDLKEIKVGTRATYLTTNAKNKVPIKMPSMQNKGEMSSINEHTLESRLSYYGTQGKTINSNSHEIYDNLN